MKWVYRFGGQYHGPADESRMATLISAGVLTASTPVRAEGGGEFRPLRETALAIWLRNAFRDVTPQRLLRVLRRSEIFFAIFAGTGTLALYGLFFCICLALTAWEQAGPLLWPVLAASAAYVVCSGLLITAVVFFCIDLYHLWRVVPAGENNVTPGQAVGLLFIPFFQWYWVFRAFCSLASALHQTGEQEGTPVPCHWGLAGLCAVSFVLAPVLYLPFALPGALLYFLFLHQMNRAAGRILKKRIRQQKAPFAELSMPE